MTLPTRTSVYFVWPWCLIWWLTAAQGHPDLQEDRLLFHFAVGLHPIVDGQWQDATHQFQAEWSGEPRVMAHGPTEALRLNGRGRGLRLRPIQGDLQSVLPRRAFSVAAWVVLQGDSPAARICGTLQENGDKAAGWWLGCQRGRFTLAVTTQGTVRGGGPWTQVTGGPPILPGRWYYVVGTYDGATMRLFVNGRLEEESHEASGDVRYEGARVLAVGADRERASQDPGLRALYEVKAYARALSEEEIAAKAAKNANLIAFRPAKKPKLEFLVKPYLQFGTTTSMRVLCETNRPASMKVEFGERATFGQTMESMEPRRISEVVLNPLRPHTTYFYAVTCQGTDGSHIKSDLCSFQTAPPEDMPWAFGIIGDTQRNPEVTRRCADGAFALRPNFVMHCGDVVDDGFAKNQWLQDLFEPCSRLFAHVPVFPVIGNHEQNSHWYYDYFSLPAPEYYYTFHYGNAQFFMVDSNKPLGAESEQYRWLEKQLADSRATWKFTCHHHPCFSSDENDYGDHVQGAEGERYTWGDPNAQKLVPLYEKYGVDIAFNGHIHVYERTWPIFQMSINPRQGVRYITSGGGGGNLEQAAPQRSWFSVYFKRAHHFCYATVHDRTIQFKAIDVDDRLFDTFELTKEPSRINEVSKRDVP